MALGEETDLEALNFQPSTKADTRQNVQLTPEPAFLPNAVLGFDGLATLVYVVTSYGLINVIEPRTTVSLSAALNLYLNM